MTTKSEIIRQNLQAGNIRKAISIASKFFDKSDRTAACKAAQSAYLSPDFMRQCGKDPQALINTAAAMLRAEFLGE